MNISSRLVAALYLACLAVLSTACFPVVLLTFLVTAPFDRRRVALHRANCMWAAAALHIFPPWSLKVFGRHHFRPQSTYVIVSNHQSLLDILLAFQLYRHFKWVSKIEIFRIPLVGWSMTLNQYVRLARGDQRSVRRMYAACERHLAMGNSLFMFPEGTRSESGAVQPFKSGAFALAKRARVPVLPVVIDGSREALPKHSMSFHGRQHMTLEVLEEIPAETVQTLTATELAALAHQRIKSALETRRASREMRDNEA